MSLSAGTIPVVVLLRVEMANGAVSYTSWGQGTQGSVGQAQGRQSMSMNMS